MMIWHKVERSEGKIESSRIISIDLAEKHPNNLIEIFGEANGNEELIARACS